MTQRDLNVIESHGMQQSLVALCLRGIFSQEKISVQSPLHYPRERTMQEESISSKNNLGCPLTPWEKENPAWYPGTLCPGHPEGISLRQITYHTKLSCGRLGHTAKRWFLTYTQPGDISESVGMLEESEFSLGPYSEGSLVSLHPSPT